MLYYLDKNRCPFFSIDTFFLNIFSLWVPESSFRYPQMWRAQGERHRRSTQVSHLQNKGLGKSITANISGAPSRGSDCSSQWRKERFQTSREGGYDQNFAMTQGESCRDPLSRAQILGKNQSIPFPFFLPFFLFLLFFLALFLSLPFLFLFFLSSYFPFYFSQAYIFL